jgi:hypothetical protein
LGSVAEPDELLTVAEIAALLKMNQQSIRNWIFSPETAGLRCVDSIRGRCVDVPFM